MDSAHSARQIPALGPKSREALARAGITTIEQLRALGSVEAFVRVRRVDQRVSLNLLWGLESAITGEPWQVVARVHRASLLLMLEQRERGGGPFVVAESCEELHPGRK